MMISLKIRLRGLKYTERDIAGQLLIKLTQLADQTAIVLLLLQTNVSIGLPYLGLVELTKSSLVGHKTVIFRDWNDKILMLKNECASSCLHVDLSRSSRKAVFKIASKPNHVLKSRL